MEKGKKMLQEEELEGESLDSHDSESVVENEQIYAAKYYRFFYLQEGSTFVVFIEHAINRDHEVQLMEDQETLLVNLKIPMPPDELFKLANVHASMAKSLIPVEEEFFILAPVKLDPTSKEKLFFPNAKTPIWTVFKWKFQKKVIVEEPDKVEVDNSNLFGL
jgi:hypothetical protein